MRTVVVGNRELAKHVLVHLLETDWNVVGAIAPTGSSARKQAGYVPFDDIAEAHEIDLLETADINDEATKRRLGELDPDLCICPGWHQIVDEAVLDIPDRGFVGFHASDLPKGRGGAPVNWSIINGQTAITLSLFYYSPGVDAGDIVHKEHVRIEDRDDVDTVLDKLAVAACEALTTVREPLETGTMEAVPQSLESASYRPRRRPQDGLVDWSRPADAVADWVRAQTDPYPGAYTFVAGERITVWSAEVVDGDETATPGSIVSIIDGEGVDVATGDGLLRLRRVQARGQPRTWADTFAQRRDLGLDASFGREHAPSSWRYTSIRDGTGALDFLTATNLRVGERGTVLAVVDTAIERSIEVRAVFDGETVRETATVAAGCRTLPVSYEPDSAGTHSLRIDFFEDGDRLDERFLKVFATA